ncbi:hypothetical protein BU26DRAFT_516484 [Trematosphaeria pertusa]|uniref:F-box domain-containing protein n=1 Tax=Trematosphaeria pertusa TaxID=390896 RepID=A0A6A6IN88_9PLEO|nr:uncharacterized protein BU26DRAFT_516484 [Trematosphaeria pertusa]KAF2251709.1 hypothetical protein BU26DRAFT_516484 [Trematosphaeria pertusa]
MTQPVADPPPLYRLPNELLLHVAEHVDAAEVADLLSLSQVSKRVRPIAEDLLYRCVKLGPPQIDEPAANGMPRLLLTILTRPELAEKMRALQFVTVRKNLCGAYHMAGLDFEQLRLLSLAKLVALGYKKGHPWHRMVEASIESAYGGLLLAILSNLTTLDVAVLDCALAWDRLNSASSDPIMALFGTLIPPKVAIGLFQQLVSLAALASHTEFLALDMPNLSQLSLANISPDDLLRLNGPASLSGAPKLHSMAISLDHEMIRSGTLPFRYSDLEHMFSAFDCPDLTNLSLRLFSTGIVSAHTEPEFPYLIKSLNSLAGQLQILDINVFPDSDTVPARANIFRRAIPIHSIRHFTSLLFFSAPQGALINGPEVHSFGDRMPKMVVFFPASLETLCIRNPTEEVHSWLAQIPKLSGHELPCLEDIVFWSGGC